MNATHNRLAECRRGWSETATQADVAAALGVATGTYQRLESGGIELTARRVRQLSALFGCHPGELFAPLPHADAIAIAARLSADDRAQWLELGRRLSRKDRRTAERRT